ncbi:MAG: homogentisate phytyltransferase [Flavobacteriales bacterium]|nr:homogentisate phytyltransferase [Flavobacteriales bacterium]MBL0034202.1 homogentisate phytyltransferase [Flavobacteriales bacterium]
MSSVGTLWRFSRPHTIVGSVISIVTLYMIVLDRAEGQRPLLLISALFVGIACNVFIVGINQLADVAIDRLNKPELPLPACELSRTQAWGIVLAALGASLGVALLVSPYLFAVVAAATFIGWAYSMPPFHLKRHHLSASLSIAMVRGVLLNLGGFLVYDHLVNGLVEVPLHVWILTVFIIAFSTSIAWFKDLPDMEGDARFGIRTLALVTSPRTALIAGHVLVGLAYLFTIAALGLHLSLGGDGPRTRVLLIGHLVLLALFLFNLRTLRRHDKQALPRFYRQFWWLFFAEYGLYFGVYLIRA